jgi:hypothetical protein
MLIHGVCLVKHKILLYGVVLSEAQGRFNLLYKDYFSEIQY